MQIGGARGMDLSRGHGSLGKGMQKEPPTWSRRFLDVFLVLSTL